MGVKEENFLGNPGTICLSKILQGVSQLMEIPDGIPRQDGPSPKQKPIGDHTMWGQQKDTDLDGNMVQSELLYIDKS